jgi:flagellar assembly protein FliH
MAGFFRLESFDAPPEPGEALSLDPGEYEEAKLASFEKGYSAGWDDAIAAQNAETTRLHSDLGRNLQELSFTYDEARASVLGALRPLLIGMTAKILPAVSRETLTGLITDEIYALADEVTTVPITVVTNPATLEQVRVILSKKSPLPLDFRAEPTLSEGQVFLRFDQSERQIDIDGLIERIGTAVRSYFNVSEEEPEDDNH